MKFVTMAISDEMHAELSSQWVECSAIRLAARNEDGTQPLLVTNDVQTARAEMPDHEVPVVASNAQPGAPAAGPPAARPVAPEFSGIPMGPEEAQRRGLHVPPEAWRG